MDDIVKIENFIRQAEQRLSDLESERKSLCDEIESLKKRKDEALKGNRKGQHSIRINDQWRICFKWRDGNAFDVEITDYH